jgi:type IV pilus assembly protein PilO
MALLDQIAALPKPQKIVIGVLPLIAIGALGFFLLIDPKSQERDALVQRNEGIKVELAKAQADEANLRQFRAQVVALRRRLEAAKDRLPAEKEIPQLYRRVTDLAFQSGLGVSLFQPKPPEDRAVYSEVPINFTADATYHQWGAFFEKMGRLNRVVTLNDFRMSGISAPTGTVRGEMVLATYVFRPEGAPPPGAKPGAPGTPAPAAPRPGTPGTGR